MDIAESSGALFESPYRVTRAQFRAFGQRALRKDPSGSSQLEAIGWIPYVPGRERGAYERARRRNCPGSLSGNSSPVAGS